MDISEIRIHKTAKMKNGEKSYQNTMIMSNRAEERAACRNAKSGARRAAGRRAAWPHRAGMSCNAGRATPTVPAIQRLGVLPRSSNTLGARLHPSGVGSIMLCAMCFPKKKAAKK